jgi:hypothetical protein
VGISRQASDAVGRARRRGDVVDSVSKFGCACCQAILVHGSRLRAAERLAQVRGRIAKPAQLTSGVRTARYLNTGISATGSGAACRALHWRAC